MSESTDLLSAQETAAELKGLEDQARRTQVEQMSPEEVVQLARSIARLAVGRTVEKYELDGLLEEQGEPQRPEFKEFDGNEEAYRIHTLRVDGETPKGLETTLTFEAWLSTVNQAVRQASVTQVTAKEEGDFKTRYTIEIDLRNKSPRVRTTYDQLHYER